MIQRERASYKSARLKTAEAYDVNSVAAILGVSPWAVYEMIRKGELRSFRVGRLVRVSAAVLEELLA